MTHELKIESKYFEDVLFRRKRFEVRKNDRSYKVGDTLVLYEIADGNRTGRRLVVEIDYILNGSTFNPLNEYAVLGFTYILYYPFRDFDESLFTAFHIY